MLTLNFKKDNTVKESMNHHYVLNIFRRIYAVLWKGNTCGCGNKTPETILRDRDWCNMVNENKNIS